MDKRARWKQRFENFSKAYDTLCRTIKRHQEVPEDEITKMAMVQAFEFTYELA